MRPIHVMLTALALSVGGLALPASGGAQGLPAPTLTVVGFGVVNLPPPVPSPPQLELNLSARSATAAGAVSSLQGVLAGVERRLAQVGVPRSAVAVQGPPTLNYVSRAFHSQCLKIAKLKPGVTCSGPGFQATEGVQVTFSSLSALASALTKSGIQGLASVQSFWINQGGQQAASPTQAALTSGYRMALASAQENAASLAAADHLRLGPVLSVVQGASLGAPCGAMGCGAVTGGINPPVLGPNQELVAVTVTYRTRAP